MTENIDDWKEQLEGATITEVIENDYGHIKRIRAVAENGDPIEIYQKTGLGLHKTD